jgi:hypothetical protein
MLFEQKLNALVQFAIMPQEVENHAGLKQGVQDYSLSRHTDGLTRVGKVLQAK